MSDASSLNIEPRVESLGVDHLVAIDQIMQRAFDPRYGEAWNSAQVLATLAMPGYRLRGCWPGRADSHLAGFAITRIVAGESELLLLAVDPDARRRGVAAALMQDWIDTCRERGVDTAFLEMREDNDARHLYQRFGFCDVALRKSYYQGADGVARNAVTMKLTLLS